jgi:hypothetical protein
LDAAIEVAVTSDWKIYRTRFLVKARQLSAPYSFVDTLGREHCGLTGDYLVETCDGSRRIAPREIFEDIYVPMGLAGELPSPATIRRPPLGVEERRPHVRRASA